MSLLSALIFHAGVAIAGVPAPVEGLYGEPDGLAVLLHWGRAPWPPSAEHTGVRPVCSSGSAGEGGCWLYEADAVVDQYLWWGGGDAGIDGLPADFNPHGHQTAVMAWPDWPVD